MKLAKFCFSLLLAAALGLAAVGIAGALAHVAWHYAQFGWRLIP